MKTIKNSLQLVLVVGLSVLLVSCRDTCNKKHGKTFSSVTLEEWDTTATGNLRVKLAMSTLPKLQNVYFEETFNNLTPKRAVNVIPSKERISFEVPKNWWRTILPNTFNGRFSFGDRRKYLDCKHPGQSDSYDLDFKFEVDTAGGKILLTNLRWEEIHKAGAI